LLALGLGLDCTLSKIPQTRQDTDNLVQWSNLLVINVPVGILLINPENPTEQPPGSIFVMDSIFTGVGTLVAANTMKKTIESTSLISLQNIVTFGTTTMIAFRAQGSVEGVPMADAYIKFQIFGNVHWGGLQYGRWKLDQVPDPAKSLTHAGIGLLKREPYFVKSRPQYEDLPTGSIVNVKILGAKGDGVTDDTLVIIRALYV